MGNQEMIRKKLVGQFGYSDVDGQLIGATVAFERGCN